MRRGWEEYKREWETNNPERMMLYRARRRAKRRGVPFTITLDDIQIPDVCPVLDIPLRLNKGGRSGYFPDSPSLDRMDPALGYVPGNVNVISARANLIKQDATAEELEKVYKYASRRS